MNDTELATYLGLNDEEAAIIVPNLKPEARGAYERMAQVEIDFSNGLTPPGVIICREHRNGKSS